MCASTSSASIPKPAAMVAGLVGRRDLGAHARGGHYPFKVYAAYHAAQNHKGQPTVILAKTVEGYGMGKAGEGQNITAMRSSPSAGTCCTRRRRRAGAGSSSASGTATAPRWPRPASRASRRRSARATTACWWRSGRAPNGGKIGADGRRAWPSPSAASSRSTSRCAPTCRTSSPSATWSASRCWRTRPRTKASSRRKSRPARSATGSRG